MTTWDGSGRLVTMQWFGGARFYARFYGHTVVDARGFRATLAAGLRALAGRAAPDLPPGGERFLLAAVAGRYIVVPLIAASAVAGAAIRAFWL